MEQKSVLEYVTDSDVVAVHNPMAVEFTCKIARSMVTRPQRQQTTTGHAAADQLMSGISQGIDNGGHQFMQHTQQTILFKPGQTINLQGGVAKVASRQIVKELMQRSGAKNRMADPNAFMEYEKKVVLNHRSMLSDLSSETMEERLQRQIDELNPKTTNEVKTDEQPFPEVGGSGQDTNKQTPGSSKGGKTA